MKSKETRREEAEARNATWAGYPTKTKIVLLTEGMRAGRIPGQCARQLERLRKVAGHGQSA